MKDLVSVIIPVYNNADVLKRCINSVITQEYPAIEVIFVNDGSTDHSGEILDGISQRNADITVFHTDNHGVSHARNLGLDNAHGKWVMFLDADDTLCKDAIQKAVFHAEKYQCDTVCFNAYKIYPDKNLKMKDISPDRYIIENTNNVEIINALYDCPSKNHLGEYFRACWGKLLSNKIIQDNSIRFPEDLKIGEDAVFLSDYFYYSKRNVFINEFIYNYYLSGNSATGRYKNDLQTIQKIEFTYLIKALKKYDIKTNILKNIFWTKGKNDFILNEFKCGKTINEIIFSTANYLKDSDVSKYLSIYDNSGIKSFMRASLLKLHLYIVVGFIDVRIFYKKHIIANRAV